MTHQEAIETLATERYLLDEMGAAERDAFEEHFFSCAECADDVRDGAMMREGAAAGFTRSAAPSARQGRVVAMAPRTRRWAASTVLPWAVAASLAVVVAYQTSRSPSDNAAIALAPSTLRPATRGQEPVVVPGPGGAVTLAVDPGATGGQGSGDLTYELRRADGGQIAAGTAPVPPAGAPLLLLVPAGRVRPNEHYVLTLHGKAAGGLTAETYRFTVGAP